MTASELARIKVLVCRSVESSMVRALCLDNETDRGLVAEHICDQLDLAWERRQLSDDHQDRAKRKPLDEGHKNDMLARLSEDVDRMRTDAIDAINRKCLEFAEMKAAEKEQP